MRSNTIKILTLLSVLLCQNACKDFFDISNPQTLSKDNFPATIEQVDQLLTSAYSGSHSIGMYAFYWFPMGVYLYDHTTDTYGSYDERATSMDNYTDIDSRYITTTYTDLCKWIRLATTAIDGIDRYREAYATTSEQETLNYMRGQALFNRALAYWHAQIFFEMNADAWGFPIIDRVISDVEALKLRRATVADTWQFMLNDLQEAIPLLQGHNDPFRASEWAAKGLLAKAYMQSLYIFPENRIAAKNLLEDIINNSGKSLVATDIYKDMFYGNVANEHNSESLYELTMTVNPNQNGPWENYTTGSGMAMVYAPWYMDLDIRFRAGREDQIDPITLENDITTCKKSSEWGNNFIHDRNIARFGFWDFYGDTVPRLTFNPDYSFSTPRSLSNFPYMLHNPTYRADAIALKNNPEKVDPRLMLCAGQPFVDKYIDAQGRETYYDRSTEVNNRHDIVGWQHRKYTNTRGVEMGGGDYGKNQSSDCNIYIVRLADIYLLYAELMQEDNPATALEYVNKVHRRAYGYTPDEASPYDYRTLTDRTRTYDENDHLSHNVIRYERWAELFAEGQWWYDVRRYRIGPSEAAYYKTTRHGPITWKGDESYVQPIPQLELERNGNIQQSNGYPHL
ncbi:MAG: RagB/SusD family nutrient uptake outer membrane protein [Paludibacter sp.]|nr:RagB/SusD family nutrient uptake outer membrane protein [Bacteroidales bacterium]MCM1069627.1 RagB/SusD family nutrient uptake outer membrane protein [Prevotella sp.]MCM1354273.1 RagB/SusD family nutrient uptake outer membrane protein [Bacteroides sp.]MCM1443112.1 RagB/SusD family nutrient uptake outer membrane protein [Muribaculum sp.]MCM1482347.1 RagB/SusD family nutrient uptake outer membrane protein [Paludibacter sp.]